MRSFGSIVVLTLALVGGVAAATPAERAKDLVGQMTLEEKLEMVHGIPGPYVGNVRAIDRLGIPALTLNDGPQGFRAKVPGTSTMWPSGLTV